MLLCEVIGEVKSDSCQDGGRVTKLLWFNHTVFHATYERLVSPVISHYASYIRQHIPGSMEVDEHEVRLERIKNFLTPLQFADVSDVIGIIELDSCCAAYQGLVDSLVIDQEGREFCVEEAVTLNKRADVVALQMFSRLHLKIKQHVPKGGNAVEVAALGRAVNVDSESSR